MKIKGAIQNRIYDINKYIESVNPNKIYLDVDGVLLHSCQAVIDVCNKTYEYDLKLTGKDIVNWNFKEIDDFDDTVIEYLFSCASFFRYVKWIDGALDFIKRHEKDIVIVTKGNNVNIYRKMQMFSKLGLDVPVCGLPLSCSKSSINMDGGLLIDDCTKNLNESNATYKIQFLEYDDGKNDIRKWTKDWNGLRMYKY